MISQQDFEKARNDLAAARINDKHAIELTVHEASGGTEIVVLDRGSGMSGKVLEQALLPFYSSQANGTGLGLTLSREIIEAHGTRRLLAPRADGGRSVSVRLPAAPTGVI